MLQKKKILKEKLKYKNIKILFNLSKKLNFKNKAFKLYPCLIHYNTTFVFFTTNILQKKINKFVNKILKLFINIGLNISINNVKIIKYNNNFIKFSYLGFIFLNLFQKYIKLNNISKKCIYFKTKKFLKIENKFYVIYPNIIKFRKIKYYINKILQMFRYKNIYWIIKSLNSMFDL